jgi:hypothetical protein
LEIKFDIIQEWLELQTSNNMVGIISFSVDRTFWNFELEAFVPNMEQVLQSPRDFVEDISASPSLKTLVS